MVTISPPLFFFFFNEEKHSTNLREGKPGEEMGSNFVETYWTLQIHVYSTRLAGFEKMQEIQQ